MKKVNPWPLSCTEKYVHLKNGVIAAGFLFVSDLLFGYTLFDLPPRFASLLAARASLLLACQLMSPFCRVARHLLSGAKVDKATHPAIRHAARCALELEVRIL